MCEKAGAVLLQRAVTAPVGTMSDSVSSCTFAVNWDSPQVYSCYFSNIKTQTLPAKWQNQNYTWLSSTSTTTITVLLASVPAGRNLQHPQAPQVRQAPQITPECTAGKKYYFENRELNAILCWHRTLLWWDICSNKGTLFCATQDTGTATTSRFGSVFPQCILARRSLAEAFNYDILLIF